MCLGHASIFSLLGWLKASHKSAFQVVKQSVMTTVYGVTSYGVKKQIKKHLADQFPEEAKDPWLHHASQYIASKLHLSMGTIFKSSTEIQVGLNL